MHPQLSPGFVLAGNPLGYSLGGRPPAVERVMIPKPNGRHHLGSIARGWALYVRHGCSSDAFGVLNHHLWWRTWRWLRKKHHAPEEGSSAIATDRPMVAAEGIRLVRSGPCRCGNA